MSFMLVLLFALQKNRKEKFSVREKEIILLLQYIVNNRQELEQELRELQQNVRYRKVSVNDCLELALCRERLSMFNQVTRDIVSLLKLGNYKDFE